MTDTQEILAGRESGFFKKSEILFTAPSDDFKTPGLYVFLPTSVLNAQSLCLLSKGSSLVEECHFPNRKTQRSNSQCGLVNHVLVGSVFITGTNTLERRLKREKLYFGSWFQMLQSMQVPPMILASGQGEYRGGGNLCNLVADMKEKDQK